MLICIVSIEAKPEEKAPRFIEKPLALEVFEGL